MVGQVAIMFFAIACKTDAISVFVAADFWAFVLRPDDGAKKVAYKSSLQRRLQLLRMTFLKCSKYCKEKVEAVKAMLNVICTTSATEFSECHSTKDITSVVIFAFQLQCRTVCTICLWYGNIVHSTKKIKDHQNGKLRIKACFSVVNVRQPTKID